MEQIDVASESKGSIAVVAAPLIALTAIDLFMLLFGLHRWLVGSQGRWIIMYGHFLFAPAAMWVVVVAGRLGRRGWIVGLSSFVLTYVIMIRFRGPWVWQGILDYWQESKKPWVLSALVGIALGLIFCGLVIRRSNNSLKLPDDIKFISILGVCGIITFMASYLWPFDSIFAPTFHLAIGAVTMVLIGFWFWFIRSEVQSEKGIYAN
jgi:hypothetical protein